MGARNRVGIGLSYRPARLHRRGIDSLESIPGLLKSLKIRALVGRRYDNPTPTRFLAPIDSSKISAQVLGRGSTGIPKKYTIVPEEL
jgi:hypothetical protein